MAEYLLRQEEELLQAGLDCEPDHPEENLSSMVTICGSRPAAQQNTDPRKAAAPTMCMVSSSTVEVVYFTAVRRTTKPDLRTIVNCFLD